MTTKTLFEEVLRENEWTEFGYTEARVLSEMEAEHKIMTKKLIKKTIRQIIKRQLSDYGPAV